MISIIIPVYNQHEITENCIRAVLDTTENCEIILVDNGSNPPIKPPFSGFIDIKLIRNEENKGFPVAVNQGISESSGDTIILLNNDVFVTQNALNRMEEWLDTYDIVGCLTNYCAGIQRVETEKYNTIEQLNKVASNISSIFQYPQEIGINWVIGFCMAFKRSTYDFLGKFDESMWPCSGEDIDFCLRARDNGYTIGIAEDVYVHHEGSQTFKDMWNAGVIEQDLFSKTDKKLLDKWKDLTQIYTKHPYVIFSPEYSNSSAGIRALYKLNDMLNSKGYDSIVTDSIIDFPDDAIIVYPEIVSFNPLNAKNVVRYILNTPGKIGKSTMFGLDDLIFTWNKEYYDASTLFIPLIEDFFNDYGLERNGACFWVGKGKDIPRIPETEGLTEITYEWPKTREGLAQLLNEKETFYTYDNNTMLISEAEKCGCRVIVIGEKIERDYDKLAKNSEKELANFIKLTQQLAEKNIEKEIKLAIGIPCTFPHIPSSFFYSYALMDKPSHIFIHADNGHIDDLRNNIVERALAEGCTHLIMMDVDQIYPENTITRLLSHNLPIVGCRVHRRYPPFDSLMLKLVEIDKTHNQYDSIDDWDEDELVEVDATGGGCLMFNMDIFKKVPYPWFETKKTEAGNVIGEDIHFCQKLKNIGYRIFVDSSLECGHLTTMIVNRKTNLLYRSMKQKEHQRNLQEALKIDKE